MRRTRGRARRRSLGRPEAPSQRDSTIRSFPAVFRADAAREHEHDFGPGLQEPAHEALAGHAEAAADLGGNSHPNIRTRMVDEPAAGPLAAFRRADDSTPPARVRRRSPA